jgi:hypothetical protein
MGGNCGGDFVLPNKTVVGLLLVTEVEAPILRGWIVAGGAKAVTAEAAIKAATIQEDPTIIVAKCQVTTI